MKGKLRQRNLFEDERSLFEKLCDPVKLRAGFKAVKRNNGSPGIDGVTIREFESRLEEELAQLQMELESWRYKPKPVRRVEIPKPGKGAGVRLLGVPCTRDRVVHATIKLLLEPILDPNFSDHSYGFRPGYNQRQAVESAQRIVESGKEYVIDIDLSKFFDRINHDRLIHLLSAHIDDKQILRLIGDILRSGIMKDGLIEATKEGTTQGSPLSPLLSNVILDELDKELERRGLEFCRFADDCNIFVRSSKAAERVMKSISKFIEGKLKLKINRDKSRVGRSCDVKFLGMTIINGARVISAASMKRAMQKVKELTPRGTHLTLEQTMKRINTWYKGWSGYYMMTQYPFQLRNIEAHIRRRLRSRFVDQQKKRRHLFKKLIKRGVSYGLARTVFSNNGRWVTSNTFALTKAYTVEWFIDQAGQWIRSNHRMRDWFPIHHWIRVT
ncbi:MAG: group II intron reverse transcriptase/maturase [Desulfocapsa sp.]|nr:MAG: group II intron reverse transcriptase/maturase [Desulfocapsa sp.]